MHGTAQDWQPQVLQLALQHLLPGLQVQALASVGSTSTELLDRVRGQPHAAPSLLLAEQQTAGRGRQGKAWWSQAGASLTFSLALPLAPADWSGLSLAVGLALAECLDPTVPGQPPRLGIKWPNDLLLRVDPQAAPPPGLPGHKLGGILVETVVNAGRRWAVVGVGLNLRPRPAALAAQQPLPWGHASLQALQPQATGPQLLGQVAPALLRALLAFEHTGFAPLQSAFARRDLLAGLSLSAPGTDAGAPLRGVADGVDAQGVLWLRNRSGRHPVRSGEPSLRREAMPPDAAGLAGAAPC